MIDLKNMKVEVLFGLKSRVLDQPPEDELVVFILIDITLKNSIWKNISTSRNNFIRFPDEVKDNILRKQEEKKNTSKTGGWSGWKVGWKISFSFVQT